MTPKETRELRAAEQRMRLKEDITRLRTIYDRVMELPRQQAAALASRVLTEEYYAGEARSITSEKITTLGRASGYRFKYRKTAGK